LVGAAILLLTQQQPQSEDCAARSKGCTDEFFANGGELVAGATHSRFRILRLRRSTVPPRRSSGQAHRYTACESGPWNKRSLSPGFTEGPECRRCSDVASGQPPTRSVTRCWSTSSRCSPRRCG